MGTHCPGRCGSGTGSSNLQVTCAAFEPLQCLRGADSHAQLLICAERTLGRVAGDGLALAVELAVVQTQINEPALQQHTTPFICMQCTMPWLIKTTRNDLQLQHAVREDARSGSRRCRHLRPRCAPAARQVLPSMGQACVAWHGSGGLHAVQT